MRPHLIHPDRDIDFDEYLPVHVDEVADEMADDDQVIHDVAKHVLLGCSTDVDVVRFRQAVTADCLEHEDTIRQLYDLASQTLLEEHEIFRSVFAKGPESMLRHAVQVLKVFLTALRSLRDICQTLEGSVRSAGLRDLCAEVRTNLDDAYLDVLAAHVKRLQLKDGLLLSAHLGPTGGSSHMIMRTPRAENRTLFHRNAVKRPTFDYTIPERDEAGFRSLSDFRDRGLAAVADAAEQSADDVLGFFRSLHAELAFYVGAQNLVHELDRLGVETCVPHAVEPGAEAMSAQDLREVALAIESRTAPVPVDLNGDGKRLIVITGANRGGKSTALRAIGLAHLLMQAGLPVAARSFTASLRPHIFTHFKREEDQNFGSGKFDEDLRRMKDIVHDISSGSLLLCNESFSSTNEAEGSRIGLDVVTALADAGVTVCLVTHMYDFSLPLQRGSRPTTFLRAERGEGGNRPYRLVAAPPLPTSYGEDVYAQVFGHRPQSFSSGDEHLTASGTTGPARASEAP